MQNARSRQLSMTLFLGEKRCLVLLVGENEVVVDWRSCIRRRKNNVYLILMWVHLEKELYCIVLYCWFDLGFGLFGRLVFLSNRQCPEMWLWLTGDLASEGVRIMCILLLQLQDHLEKSKFLLFVIVCLICVLASGCLEFIHRDSGSNL